MSTQYQICNLRLFYRGCPRGSWNRTLQWGCTSQLNFLWWLVSQKPDNWGTYIVFSLLEIYLCVIVRSFRRLMDSRYSVSYLINLMLSLSLCLSNVVHSFIQPIAPHWQLLAVVRSKTEKVWHLCSLTPAVKDLKTLGTTVSVWVTFTCVL